MNFSNLEPLKYPLLKFKTTAQPRLGKLYRTKNTSPPAIRVDILHQTQIRVENTLKQSSMYVRGSKLIVEMYDFTNMGYGIP